MFYPDVMVSCEGVDLDGDVLGAPVLTAEVLSPSTEVFADVYAGLDELVAGL